tara:strand:+ start:87 stop:371 length:285 start_codon:yes stop_codon:yes gene_type:complete
MITELPERWKIRQDTDEEVCEWFREYDNTRSAKIDGSFKYLGFSQLSKEAILINSDGAECYIRITFDEFKKFVLNVKSENYSFIVEILDKLDIK